MNLVLIMIAGLTLSPSEPTQGNTFAQATELAYDLEKPSAVMSGYRVCKVVRVPSNGRWGSVMVAAVADKCEGEALQEASAAEPLVNISAGSSVSLVLLNGAWYAFSPEVTDAFPEWIIPGPMNHQSGLAQ